MTNTSKPSHRDNNTNNSKDTTLDPVGTLHHDGGVLDQANTMTHQYKRLDANTLQFNKLSIADSASIMNELTPLSLLQHDDKQKLHNDRATLAKPADTAKRAISPTATTITNSTSNSNATNVTTTSATSTTTTPSKSLKIDTTQDDSITPPIQPLTQTAVIQPVQLMPVAVNVTMPPIQTVQVPAYMTQQYVQPTPLLHDTSLLNSAVQSPTLMYSTVQPQAVYPNMYGLPPPVETPADNGSSLHSVAHLIRDNNNVVIKFLPNTFTQENLQQLCITFGDILSCRLIRDRNTGVSLGYGFVTFDNDVAASKAVNALNGLPIDNKILRAALARPITPAQIQNNSFTYNTRLKQNIYVAGLPRSYTVDDLNRLFGKYGTITESRILLDRVGQSRGVGFVRYTDNESAAAAIQALNSTQIQSSDELLVVRYARDSSSIPSGGQQRMVEQHNVYSNNMSQMDHHPYMVDKAWQTLPHQQAPYTQTHSAAQQQHAGPSHVFNFSQVSNNEAAQQYDAVGQQYSPYSSYQPQPAPQYYTQQQVYAQQVQSPTYPNTPTSLLARQVAQAVTMTPAATPSHSAQIQQQQHQQPQQTHEVYDHQQLQQHDQYDESDSPRLEARRSFDRTGVSLFVFHLPSDMTDNELHQLFSTAGPVLSAKVMINSDVNQSKGYGFVNFATAQAAHHAITRFNGKKLGGKFLKVSLKQRR